MEHIPGGDEVCRQIEFQKEKDFGNWQSLKEALMRRAPMEDETLTLKSVNTPQPLNFQVGHAEFTIGSDQEQADGWIPGDEYGKPPCTLWWDGTISAFT